MTHCPLGIPNFLCSALFGLILIVIYAFTHEKFKLPLVLLIGLSIAASLPYIRQVGACRLRKPPAETQTMPTSKRENNAVCWRADRGVDEEEHDTLFVDYAGFAPILVEGMKEHDISLHALAEKVLDLETQRDSSQGKGSRSSDRARLPDAVASTSTREDASSLPSLMTLECDRRDAESRELHAGCACERDPRIEQLEGDIIELRRVLQELRLRARGDGW